MLDEGGQICILARAHRRSLSLDPPMIWVVCACRNGRMPLRAGRLGLV